jgi:hypothetical protein
VGAIDGQYNRSSFSSFGPTADGRIKPDVVALGSGTSSILPGGAVSFGNGTSFSCPLIASLVAGVWQNWPDLTALEIVDLIRQAGSNYFNPDNSLGYGVPTYQAIKNIIDFPAEGYGILVYPNPVTEGDLHIAMAPNDGSVVTVVVQSIFGQALQKATYESNWNLNPFTLNLASLTPGVYLVQVSNKNTIKTFQVIKK